MLPAWPDLHSNVESRRERRKKRARSKSEVTRGRFERKMAEKCGGPRQRALPSTKRCGRSALAFGSAIFQVSLKAWLLCFRSLLRKWVGRGVGSKLGGFQDGWIFKNRKKWRKKPIFRPTAPPF